MSVNGFKTVGNPKIKGSLILKNAGTDAILPIDFACEDLQKTITTITTEIITAIIITATQTMAQTEIRVQEHRLSANRQK